MANDDAPVGRVLSRREILKLSAASGALLLPGWSFSRSLTPSKPLCVARPEQTEGPYFVDEALNRTDIRSDPTDRSVSPGARLDVTLRVSRLGGGACAPLAGAVVDLWHCDALGIYSDVSDPSFDTTGKKFLRGLQVTGADGAARFTTIYPGWYPGRAVHIHFKIRSEPKATPGYEFVSQLYFDDARTDEVHARPPYASKTGRRRRNADDGIYRHGGKELLLDVAPSRDGWAGTFDVALQGV